MGIKAHLFLVWVLWHMGPFRLESLVRVGRVVDDLELSVFVEESVAALDVSFAVPLLVAELAVIAKKKL